MSRLINKTSVKKPEPFIECYRCGQKYITDIKKIHGIEGGQYINFIATKQFIRRSPKTAILYPGEYLCVDSNAPGECRMRCIMRSLGESCK